MVLKVQFRKQITTTGTKVNDTFLNILDQFLSTKLTAVILERGIHDDHFVYAWLWLVIFMITGYFIVEMFQGFLEFYGNPLPILMVLVELERNKWFREGSVSGFSSL